MPFPVARTRDEAHLYLDLHPCEVCGSVETTWRHGIVLAEGTPVGRYAGTCAGCGNAREHLFGLPEHEVVPVGYPTFGGPEPSRLLDAGEWLWVADLTSRNAPADDPAEERRALAIAVAAVDEIVKFLGPGDEAVPERAFWSRRGRRERDAEPARFTRDRLRALREDYRDRLSGHRAGDAPERREEGD
ncbi:hypothetical protein [Actinoallomurus soli]|uniref:hypothetical protein n=1 Tax=Actinoallomurus soli TaxID=2952535 RepID=UPI0020931C40|nr:hypothetical protein [Actinoallomurus soli]MCO5968733.1 hypothetical protein [Actinoallomurus soli]